MNINLPDFAKTRILVVGDVMLDRYLWGSVGRISPEAPIPIVHVQDRTYRLGGAANVAANLAGIGCQVFLAGILGQDPSADTLCNLLTDRKIKNISVNSALLPTVTKTRIMGSSQQVLRLDDEYPNGVDDDLRNKVFEKLKQKINEVDALIISDYGKGLLEPSFAQKCITLGQGKDVPVFVDPKYDDWSIYAGAFCITPNLKEFQQACQLIKVAPKPLEPAAQNLIKHYNLGHLLVTQGIDGMSLLGGQETYCTLPSQAREVFDVSGAGDTVIALLSATYAAGCSMQQAMEIANLGAGEVVGHVGTYAITKTDLMSAFYRYKGIEETSGICSWRQAYSLVEYWRLSKQTIVFTNGCFDLLHPGHISLLKQAKSYGDKLIVGLNSDASVKRIKDASRPILSETDRAAILEALECVDIVVLFDEDTPIELIKFLRPNVLIKGNDYSKHEVVGADIVGKWGGKVKLVPIIDGKSSSKIIEQILYR